MDMPHLKQELSGLISQAADAHPVLQRPPKTQGEEADEDVRLEQGKEIDQGHPRHPFVTDFEVACYFPKAPCHKKVTKQTY